MVFFVPFLMIFGRRSTLTKYFCLRKFEYFSPQFHINVLLWTTLLLKKISWRYVLCEAISFLALSSTNSLETKDPTKVRLTFAWTNYFLIIIKQQLTNDWAIKFNELEPWEVKMNVRKESKYVMESLPPFLFWKRSGRPLFGLLSRKMRQQGH